MALPESATITGFTKLMKVSPPPEEKGTYEYTEVGADGVIKASNGYRPRTEMTITTLASGTRVAVGSTFSFASKTWLVFKEKPSKITHDQKEPPTVVSTCVLTRPAAP